MTRRSISHRDDSPDRLPNRHILGWPERLPCGTSAPPPSSVAGD